MRQSLPYRNEGSVSCKKNTAYKIRLRVAEVPMLRELREADGGGQQPLRVTRDPARSRVAAAPAVPPERYF